MAFAGAFLTATGGKVPVLILARARIRHAGRVVPVGHLTERTHLAGRRPLAFSDHITRTHLARTRIHLGVGFEITRCTLLAGPLFYPIPGWTGEY